MKKIIIAALMAGITTAPALAQPFGGQDRGPRVEQTQRTVTRTTVFRQDGRHDYRGWSRGERFDSRRAPYYRVVSNPRAYRLYDAPRGYHWVRSGDDAVLVGLTSGIVAAVLANRIR